MYRAVTAGEALGGKYPEWIVFVVTCDEAGRANLMPAGWCMVCSSEPPMLAVALGHGRHSAAVIERTGEFNLAFAGVGQVDLVTATGHTTGREVDKFAACGLSRLPATVNRAPLFAGCARFFECRLAGTLPAGDHTIYTGEVVAAHVAEPPLANLVNFGGWYGPAKAG